jgi:hypothetical protein
VNDLKIFKINTNETLYMSCEEIWINDLYKYIYSIMLITIQYILPLIIVTLTNLKICHYLYYKVPTIYSYTYKKKKRTKSDAIGVKFTQTKVIRSNNENTCDISHNNNNNNNNQAAETIEPLIINTPITFSDSALTTTITTSNTPIVTSTAPSPNSNSSQIRKRSIFLSDGKFVVRLLLLF